VADLRATTTQSGKPGAELAALAETYRHTPLSRGLILIAAHGLHAAYPNLDPAGFLTRRAVRDLPRVADECVATTVSHWLRTDPLLPKPVTAFVQLRAILEQNSPGDMDPHVPVLIVHGDRDDIVPAALTARLQARYCALGAAVSRRLYTGQDHFGVADASSRDALQWMSARFAGSAAPDDCPR
jgi:pimeloyl-ACP methyl ester carboxylesterase